MLMKRVITSNFLRLLHQRQVPSSCLLTQVPIERPADTLLGKHCTSGLKSQNVCAWNFPITEVRRCFHTSSPQLTLEDHNTKALTIWGSLKEVRRSPVPALCFGLSGLLPFIAAPTYLIASNAFLADVAFAQVAYGAVILSFLGGIRWGFTIPEENPVQPDWVNLGYSVTPSLIAWSGLLLPQPYSLFTVIGGLGFVAYFDMSMYGYPPWFKGMRFILSFIAIISLWSTFMCSFMLEGEKGK